MKGTYINPVYRLAVRDAASVPRKISYSQWSMYERCPLSWKLSYIDGLAPFQASIETVFGTAFHETFQYFLTVMYTESVKKAEALDLRGILQNKLREEYARCVQEFGGEHFSNPLQLTEYLEDGVAILEWFKKRRSAYFSSKGWELVGIELDLCVQASDSNSSVYGPEVNQKSKLAFTAAFNSGAPKTFPVTGITDSPATKVFLG